MRLAWKSWLAKRVLVAEPSRQKRFRCRIPRKARSCCRIPRKARSCCRIPRQTRSCCRASSPSAFSLQDLLAKRVLVAESLAKRVLVAESLAKRVLVAGPPRQARFRCRSACHLPRIFACDLAGWNLINRSRPNGTLLIQKCGQYFYLNDELYPDIDFAFPVSVDSLSS